MAAARINGFADQMLLQKYRKFDFFPQRLRPQYHRIFHGTWVGMISVYPL